MPMRISLLCGLMLSAAVILLACGGGNTAQKPGAVASPARSATSAAQSSVSATPRAAASTATPSSSSTPAITQTGTATPAATGTPAATDAAGCLRFPLTPLSAADGTVTARPAIDGSKWTIPQQDIPKGFTNVGGGDLKAESISPTTIAIGTADPPASLAHLQQIGMLGGRQQQWAGPQAGGLTSVVQILHIAFNDDRGAANFLSNPVITASACVKEESGPNVGQATRHFSYSAPVKTDNGAPLSEDGHGVMWRCGRVLINVVEVGAAGQFTQAMTDDLARNVQALFVKSDQCS
ncbi:MAG: hypothetical protein ACYDCQ_13220 [Dehalococcoidia bacterium]